MDNFSLHSTKALFLLITFVVASLLTSCDISYSRSNSGSTMVWGKGIKKITKSSENKEMSLEANQMIDIDKGVISDYEEGLVIKLAETRGEFACDAELIEENGVLKLLVKNDELISTFYENETAWLEDFLLSINNDTGAHSATTLAGMSSFSKHNEVKDMLASVYSLNDPIPSSELKLILKGLKSISMSSSRKDILDALLDKELEKGDQVAVAESIFDNISMSSDRTYLILKLIKGQKLCVSCKEYIVDNINNLAMSSQREEVLKAMLKH